GEVGGPCDDDPGDGPDRASAKNSEAPGHRHNADGSLRDRETEFWPLLTIALVGTLSPTASDVSVFAPLEQTLLSNAVVPQKRTSIFAAYSLIGSVLSAVGCLFASAPEIVARTVQIHPNRALQGMFLVYALLGVIAVMLYRLLESPPETSV